MPQDLDHLIVPHVVDEFRNCKWKFSKRTAAIRNPSLPHCVHEGLAKWYDQRPGVPMPPEYESLAGGRWRNGDVLPCHCLNLWRFCSRVRCQVDIWMTRSSGRSLGAPQYAVGVPDMLAMVSIRIASNRWKFHSAASRDRSISNGTCISNDCSAEEEKQRLDRRGPEIDKGTYGTWSENQVVTSSVLERLIGDTQDNICPKSRRWQSNISPMLAYMGWKHNGFEDVFLVVVLGDRGRNLPQYFGW